MPILHNVITGIKALLHRQQQSDDLTEELRSFELASAEEKIRSGLTPQEAQRAARVEMASMETVKQKVRSSTWESTAESITQDIRYSLRMMARSPAFTAVVIFTLALGIGASTAVFSLINAVLLRSLPYGDSSRLVCLYTPNPKYNLPAEIFSPSNADFFDLKKQSQSFSDMTFFNQATFSLAAPGAAGNTDTVIRVGAAKIDANFFSTFQVSPELGRTITPTDNQPGHDRVVLISHSLWQSAFNQRADILTQSLLLDGKSYRILSVMPPAFQYPQTSGLRYGNASIRNTQLWIPQAFTPQQIADRDDSSGNLIARLAPGVTIAQAQAEMTTLMSRIDRLHAADSQGNTALIESFNDTVLGPVRPLMRILFGAVLFVLIIACGNAANLLLARAASRHS